MEKGEKTRALPPRSAKPPPGMRAEAFQLGKSVVYYKVV